MATRLTKTTLWIHKVNGDLAFLSDVLFLFRLLVFVLYVECNKLPMTASVGFADAVRASPQYQDDFVRVSACDEMLDTHDRLEACSRQ